MVRGLQAPPPTERAVLGHPLDDDVLRSPVPSSRIRREAAGLFWMETRFHDCDTAPVDPDDPSYVRVPLRLCLQGMDTSVGGGSGGVPQRGRSFKLDLTLSQVLCQDFFWSRWVSDPKGPPPPSCKQSLAPLCTL